jgi:hypothetical protein
LQSAGGRKLVPANAALMSAMLPETSCPSPRTPGKITI